MNQLSNWLLSLLFGWTGLIANGILDLFSKDQGIISKIFEHTWIVLLIAMIVIGTIIDQIVWIARWQPHKIRKYEKQAEQKVLTNMDGGIQQEMDSYTNFYAYQHQEEHQQPTEEAFYYNNVFPEESAYSFQPVKSFNAPEAFTPEVQWYPPTLPVDEAGNFVPYEQTAAQQDVQGGFIPTSTFVFDNTVSGFDVYDEPVNEVYSPPMLEEDTLPSASPEENLSVNEQPVKRRRISPSSD